ncbi:anti-sigma factor RsbA family regulatory protein [Actinoplanes sp. NPDC049599]|uniref:anti-sigma factor RsbA family regulatory protein n=1 Tax=Actinoplanes sp. NPDC049599 TaxID=3363903 RepID=UPI0037A46D4C
MTAPLLADRSTGRSPFDHPGLLYGDAGYYVGATTGFVRSALASGDAVLVAVPGPNLALIQDSLADVADHVTFADMAVAGRNPGRIIPGVLLAFAAAHAGRRVSIIGEPIWPDRTDLEYPACAAHEALINAVFAGRDAAILCPYDVSGLDETVLEDAWRTHPVMLDSDGLRLSDRYDDPLVTAASFNLPLPAPPAHAASLHYDNEMELGAVRRFVSGHAIEVLRDDDRVDDLVLAANELTANTIEHAVGGGRIFVWAEPDYLVCQIEDRGHVADPLAGRITPEPEADGGRGLILANQLCDLVRMHTTGEGTRFRLHMWR